MSSVSFELSAQLRKDIGKGASRRLRRLNNLVPAIVYGAHQDACAISLDHNKVKKALENEAFYSHILTLDIEGKKEKVVLKDVHRHPAQPRVLHLDFQRISATEKIHMFVPVHILNAETAVGVKKGGIVSHHEVSIEVTCLPADLPESINIDIAKLDLDGVIHISEIAAPKGVEFTALTHGEGHDAPVVSIHMPRMSGEVATGAPEAPAPVEAIKQQPPVK